MDSRIGNYNEPGLVHVTPHVLNTEGSPLKMNTIPTVSLSKASLPLSISSSSPPPPLDSITTETQATNTSNISSVASTTTVNTPPASTTPASSRVDDSHERNGSDIESHQLPSVQDVQVNLQNDGIHIGKTTSNSHYQVQPATFSTPNNFLCKQGNSNEVIQTSGTLPQNANVNLTVASRNGNDISTLVTPETAKHSISHTQQNNNNSTITSISAVNVNHPHVTTTPNRAGLKKRFGFQRLKNFLKKLFGFKRSATTSDKESKRGKPSVVSVPSNNTNILKSRNTLLSVPSASNTLTGVSSLAPLTPTTSRIKRVSLNIQRRCTQFAKSITWDPESLFVPLSQVRNTEVKEPVVNPAPVVTSSAVAGNSPITINHVSPSGISQDQAIKKYLSTTISNTDSKSNLSDPLVVKSLIENTRKNLKNIPNMDSYPMVLNIDTSEKELKKKNSSHGAKSSANINDVADNPAQSSKHKSSAPVTAATNAESVKDDNGNHDISEQPKKLRPRHDPDYDSYSDGVWDPDDSETDSDEDEEINPGYCEWKRRRREWTKYSNQLPEFKSTLEGIPESSYPSIYQLLVLKSRELKTPLPLPDAIKIIKSGWVATGQWPPPSR